MSKKSSMWMWYTVQYTLWIDGVEGDMAEADVIAKGLVEAQKEVEKVANVPVTVYGVHTNGTAAEYYAELDELIGEKGEGFELG